MTPTEPVARRLDSPAGPDVIEHEYDDATPASLAVIQAICALTDVDPLEAPNELGFVLHEQVDADALDTIVGDGTGTGETVVSFEISNGNTYVVAVSDDGRLTVERSDSSS